MKERKIKKLFSIVLLITLIVTMNNSQIGATISEEKENLNNLENNRDNVQTIIDKLDQEKRDIQTYINKLDAEVSGISIKLYQTEKKLSSTEKSIKKNQKKLKEAQDSIAVQYEDMKLRIQYMYENGNQEILELILNSENISDFLNKAEYIFEISEYDRKMLGKLKNTKQTIETTQNTLVEQKETLTVLMEEQKKKKRDVEMLVAAKQNEMNQYISKIAQNQEEIEKLNTKIGNKEKLIDEMEKIEAERKVAVNNQQNQNKVSNNKNSTNSNNNVSNNKSPSNAGGTNKGGNTISGFTWPLPGYHNLSSEFGWRDNPFGGSNEYHKGIDIPAPSGTTVVAAASGQVAWANYSTTAGNWIGIDHGNGIYTVYMHMSALLVSSGQKVRAGQTIGLVGTTGSSQGNHLHFSVRLNSVDVNPHTYVGS